MRQGDVLSVKLDRWGRSVKHLLAVASDLEERGIGLKCLDQPVDTTTPAGQAGLHDPRGGGRVRAGLIIERTLDGLAAARERGHCGGRSKTYSDTHVQAIMALRAAGTLSMSEIAATVGLSRATAYRAIAEAHSGV